MAFGTNLPPRKCFPEKFHAQIFGAVKLINNSGMMEPSSGPVSTFHPTHKRFEKLFIAQKRNVLFKKCTKFLNQLSRDFVRELLNTQVTPETDETKFIWWCQFKYPYVTPLKIKRLKLQLNVQGHV